MPPERPLGGPPALGGPPRFATLLPPIPPVLRASAFGWQCIGMTSGGGSPVPPDPRSTRPATGWRNLGRVLAVAAGFLAIAEIGALVLSEYVGTAVFSWLLPGLLGAGSGELASTMSYPIRRARPAPATRAIICLAGIAAPVVATVQSFRLTDIPYGPAGRWVPPVVAAVVGAVLMWLLPPSGHRISGRFRGNSASVSSADLPGSPDGQPAVRSERRSPPRHPGNRRSAGPDGSTR